MSSLPRRIIATTALCCLLASGATAQAPGGLVTGSFGTQPLELPLRLDRSTARLTGAHVEAALAATTQNGTQPQVMLTLAFRGQAPGPDIIALELAMAQDDRRIWRGDQRSLALVLDDHGDRDGLLALSGTVTGSVTGTIGDEAAAQTRPVTFSFTARLAPQVRP